MILYCIVFYTASASKYILRNQNILFLTEVILVWLEELKNCKNRFKSLIFCVIMMLGNHYPIILKLFGTIKGFIMYQIKQTALKSGYNFSAYDKFAYASWIEELKTRNPSHLFGPLAQYLGSDKWRVLNPCITCGFSMKCFNNMHCF